MNFDVVIGASADGEAPKFNGDVDDIQIWRRKLSKEEIARVAFGSAVDKTDLVLHVPLDEGRGMLVSDIASYHHTGIINGLYSRKYQS